jgi:hypothetical protein
MFVSFASDSGIRFSAHFYDASSDKVETRPVSGWVTGDDGISQATVLVPEQGLQLRVGQIQGFLAVVPNGQEKEHQPLLDTKIEAFKKALAEAKTSTPTAQA